MVSCLADHALVKGKFCPQCGEKIEAPKTLCISGHPMADQAKFCGKCGEKAAAPVNQCSKGHSIKDGAKFCGTCGENADAVTSPEKFSESKTRNSDSTPRPIAPTRPIVRTAESFLNSGNLSSHDESSSSHESLQISEKKKSYGLIATVSVLVLLLGVILLGTVSSSSEPVTVTVEMTLVDEENCFNPSWGYSDIPGGQVVVDVDGMKYFGSYDLWGESTILGCKYTAKIRNVPSDGVNYSVGMASGRRGTIYSTQDELIANDWTFSLTLG